MCVEMIGKFVKTASVKVHSAVVGELSSSKEKQTK